MIAAVKGRVDAIGLESVVVEVSGIGLEIKAGPQTLAALTVGQDVRLHTSLVVREDSWTLFGFPSADERSVFEALQTVSGIGPRIAQAALSVMSPDDLRRAVRGEDLKALQRIPGVGRKSAQRMVLEIGDKLGALAEPQLPGAQTAPPVSTPVAEEVVSALVNLGWTQAQAEPVVDGLASANPSAPDLLRAALAQLGGGRG